MTTSRNCPWVITFGLLASILVGGCGSSGAGSSGLTTLPSPFPTTPSAQTSDDANAVANLEDASTAIVGYAVSHNDSFTGLNPTSYAATGVTFRTSAVSGSSPSTGPSVVSLLVSSDGSYAILAAWAPASSTCRAIVDSDSTSGGNTLDGQTASVGSIFIATPATHGAACRASTYDTPTLPSGSSSRVGL